VLSEAFPQSCRVSKLKALYFEAKRDWSRALAIYDRILEDDPTDQVAHKRKIAIQKAQGDYVQAIELLNVYLKDFMADESAWAELASIYIFLN
jgi:tetratricopeptide (TPR) repeat protein